jgi:hypothetical protein
MKLDNKYKSMIGTWSRAFLTAVIALVSAGETDPKSIAIGGIAAVLPIVLRGMNPNDPAYGIVKAANAEVQKRKK